MEEVIFGDDYFPAITENRRKTLEMCVHSLIALEVGHEEKLERLMALIESFEKDVRLDCGYQIVKMLKGE